MKSVDLNKDGRCSLHEYLCFVHETRQYQLERSPNFDGLLIDAIRSLAEEGEVPEAQVEMAYAHHTGYHTEMAKDPKLAFEWFLKAAAQGLPLAQYEVGLRYHKGEGVGADKDLGRKWKTKAADQGLRKAVAWRDQQGVEGEQAGGEEAGGEAEAFTGLTGEEWRPLLGKDWASKEVPGTREL